MSEFYKQSIVEMVEKISDAGWLRMIYSFIKVFADDKKGGSV